MNKTEQIKSERIKNPKHQDSQVRRESQSKKVSP